MKMRTFTLPASKMATSSCFLLIIWTILVCNTQLTGCVPTTESISSSNSSRSSIETVVGVHPNGTTSTTLLTTVTSSISPPPMARNSTKIVSQKGRGKLIRKVNPYKKPLKDKGNWAKQQTSATAILTGYDAAKGIGSHHQEIPPTGTSPIANLNIHSSTNSQVDSTLDNVNSTKDYTNKSETNISTLRPSIPNDITTKRVTTNMNGNDDDYGKDIDFISIPGTTKADKTYEPTSTTIPYPATAGAAKHSVADTTQSTTTTMPTGRMESPNFNTKSNTKTTSTKHPLTIGIPTQDTKSITLNPRAILIPEHDKSLPANASLGSSLSSLSSSQHIEMTTPTTAPTTSSSTTATTALDGTTMPKLDVGHDGVKVTKKKQLFDKHYIAITTFPPARASSGSLHSPIARETDRDRVSPWSLSKTKPTKSGKKLMEVPNGYLGPIMMKEKTFSVSHHGKKLKPSLAEQLRDRKLVEIIAPTALMEPTQKVKSSSALLSTPEFVPIESSLPVATVATVSTARSVSTTTTETTSTAVTYPTTTSTSGENIEAETATTYFLVVTDDDKDDKGKDMTNQLPPNVLPDMSTDSPITTERYTIASVASDHKGFTMPPSTEGTRQFGKSIFSLTSVTPRPMITDQDLLTLDPHMIDKLSPTSPPMTSIAHDHIKITDRPSTFAPHDSSVSSDHSITTITDPVTTIADSVGHSRITVKATSASESPSSTLTPDTTPTFATINADLYHSSSISPPASLKPISGAERTESRISDIQVEVYDSTLEPILASTNFKDNSHVHYPSSHVTTKQFPSNNQHQERFTQYVVDKATDYATQDTNTVAKASGKPEPAAIEIHINVSEGFGNESEDLEFSYRQSDYRKTSSEKPGITNFITLKPFDTVPQNETSNEAAEEIVVEIIDSNSNSTENSASRENLNVNPIFTFRSDDSSQVELKNVKYYPEERPKTSSHSTDDFFVPHLGQQSHALGKPLADRDSDTIFYISNTEVKVGESLPTTNTYDAQLKKSRLESQFFPASYDERKKTAPQRYEEDIILSPLKNSIADPLKVRGPLDISYVGESIMEVEQATLTTTVPAPVPGSTPDVIIQPAVLPEMAIGVPVIGELPPQIELKEIDFMPNFDGNKEDSSIQYGGDLIDEGGAMSAAFDMDSYPLGLGHKSNLVSSHSFLNNRVNHLKKDELTADLAASSEAADGNNLLHRSSESINSSLTGERIGNATAYSVMEEPKAGDRQLSFSDMHMLLMACLATLLPLVLLIFLAFGLRHLYRKYRSNPFNVMGRNSSTDPLDVEKGAGHTDEAQTPEELCASSLAYANTAKPPPANIETRSDPSSRQANGKTTDSGNSSVGMPGRDCNGCVAHDRSSSSDTNVDGIQTIHHDEEDRRRTTPTQLLTQTGSTKSTGISAIVATPHAGTIGTMQCNYSGANGSITTMTLKNNHLIVETEERNDISRDARETKMHYNNSEKDGVFVVEVSRGADSKCMPSSPVDEKPSFTFDAAAKGAQNCVQEKPSSSSHEEVQIHLPPVDNSSTNGDVESNHLHQIDEVDESTDDGPKLAKHSNTGLSQSDLSSTSSVDSNKRYSYGNQELYTIEQQDYTTPSQAATKAPHPPQPKQTENHNDDNGHSENGHCIENSPSTTPNCDANNQAETDSDVDGSNDVESKPKITAALLKQDTVIRNDMTNGTYHNNGIADEDDEPTPHNSTEDLSNGASDIMKVFNTTIVDYPDGDIENGFDSIISLPDPPSTEEIKQMNDIILLETNQLDSLPPPPPPNAGENNNNNTNNTNHHQHNGNGNAVDQNGDDDDDSQSIASGPSPLNTPTKLVMISTPPTITIATALPSTDIPHTNGNCMTGHTTTTSAAAVVEVSGSS